MLKTADCLIEIHTAELPPKTLLRLIQAFKDEVAKQLTAASFAYTAIDSYATPRRLALLIKSLADKQPDQVIEKKGPALKAAYDAAGKPTGACIGFARSCNVTVDALYTLKSAQGEWVACKQEVPGQTIQAVLPTFVESALQSLPISKRMRWGDGETQFVRPVYAVIMLYDDSIVPGIILGCEAGRTTYGHRFLAPEAINIPNASMYASLLSSEGWVMADVIARREKIKKDATEIVEKKIGKDAILYISSDDFLDEVTNLVEWPVAICGQFDATFLNLPSEVLISAMQDHQRYFAVRDLNGKLLPHFVTISNIPTNPNDPQRIISGNERVLRARLADADFFYNEDKKQTLASRTDKLSDILFQAKLGSLRDKTLRLKIIATFIAKQLNADETLIKRAAELAKADLTTNMVSEFPALQGTMGRYYAAHDNEAQAVILALEEYYFPRFAGDNLPSATIGQILAIADRIDTLVGIFGINLLPTGDKDPYGLRRAAIGLLRILIEKHLPLDLNELITVSLAAYKEQDIALANLDVINQLRQFMLERLRGWYQEQGILSDVFAAVVSLDLSAPLDIDARIRAVQHFKQSDAAEALSVANKRVSNLLSKSAATLADGQLDSALFETEAEKILAASLSAKQKQVAALKSKSDYAAILQQLSELREPIDQFFEQVMVMTDDLPRRDNRLRLLADMRALFLQVADIALLQNS